jgi:hypothetical protein
MSKSGLKTAKKRFSALFSEDMHFRKFFFNKICFKYTHTQILSALLRILKNLFLIRQLTHPYKKYTTFLDHYNFFQRTISGIKSMKGAKSEEFCTREGQGKNEKRGKLCIHYTLYIILPMYVGVFAS